MSDLVESLRASGPLGEKAAAEIVALRQQLDDCSAAYRRLVEHTREQLRERREVQS